MNTLSGSVLRIKVGVDPILIRISSEPYVVLTALGYAPTVKVTDCKSGKTMEMFISPRTLAKELEKLRRDNGGAFSGLEFWIRKASEEKTSGYLLEPI